MSEEWMKAAVWGLVALAVLVVLWLSWRSYRAEQLRLKKLQDFRERYDVEMTQLYRWFASDECALMVLDWLDLQLAGGDLRPDGSRRLEVASHSLQAVRQAVRDSNFNDRCRGAAAPAQGQQVEWRTTAVMLEQANAGLAQLNGKLRAELSALKAQQVGQEPVAWRVTGAGGLTVTPEYPKWAEDDSRLLIESLYTAPQPAPAQDVAGLLEWAVDRWHAEVASRPLANVHRRSLDDTWRQVIRKLGGDPGLLCGPAHDALAAHDKQSGGATDGN